ncbi:universal stress protein family protein [Novosphingobium kunmingense]|uniref:Universal stress protein family protein n=1 Tax=Novosphingobium kunmingense TaxID=1211806 RepID=A0A2N0I2T4_9SPHN|nr:universal stress protein [Novosphingobium kunmingense]PKB25465.1 universal stress protein family protein [Novosphingobium kunmingense]
MRVYLVIMDETDEAATALRFAARRAARTGGQVHLLALVPRQPFVAFGGIQATIEEEARARAEALVTTAAGSLLSEGGQMPAIAVKTGNGEQVVREYLADHPEVSALVLGAAANGGPGPLVSHFTGMAGQLACPVYVIPGSLTDEDLERLS